MTVRASLVASMGLALLVGGGCGGPVDTRRPLVIWGVGLGPDSKGLEAVIREYERRNPEVRVRLTLAGSNNTPQKMMTSIVGGTPPDVVQFHAHLVPNWAGRGALTSLDAFIARDRKTDPNAPRPERYYPTAWQDVTYKGKVFALPTEGHTRLLYWNKASFRNAATALRAKGLDPNRAPRTRSELLAYSEVLTRRAKNGTLEKVGFVPMSGWHDLASWSLTDDTTLVSADGERATLDDPRVVETLEFIRKGYAILGGFEEAARFNSSAAAGASDPFVAGHVAMKLDYAWTVSGLRNDAPDFEFGVAPVPVPDARFAGEGRFRGKERFVGQGSFAAFAIPRGARNAADAWRFLSFFNGTEGRLLAATEQARWESSRGRVYYPPSILADRAADDAVRARFRPSDLKYAEPLALHAAAMRTAASPPPTGVAQLLEDLQREATSEALLGRKTSKQALADAQAVVRRRLDGNAAEARLPAMDLRPVVPIVGAVALMTVIGIALFVRRARLGPLARKEARAGVGFVFPWAFGFLALTLGPMIASAFMSFTSYDVLTSPKWIGLGNYSELSTLERENLITAFRNVLYLGGIGIPLGLVGGLSVAMLLNAAVKGIGTYRTLFYLPSITPAVAAAVLWMWVLAPDPSKGLVNAGWQATIGSWFDVPPPAWFGAEDWAKRGLIVMGLWGSGGGMVLWLAALKGIPGSLYEAASVDGASPTRQFWSITLPFLSPVIFFNVVMGIIGSLQEFERAFLVSGGGPGPGSSLKMPAYILFVNGFQYFRMGYASAIAWTIFGIVLVLTLAQFALAKRWVYYEGIK